MVNLVGVAARSDVHGDLGQRGFQLHDGFGVAGSFVFRLAYQLQHVGDVLHVLGAGLLGGVSAAEIVIAFGQAQAALVGHCDLLAGILEILLLAKAHEGVGADQLKAGEKLGQLIFAFERGNAIELRLQRFQSLLVDSVHVHAGGIRVADLLFIGSAAGPPAAAFSSMVCRMYSV